MGRLLFVCLKFNKSSFYSWPIVVFSSHSLLFFFFLPMLQVCNGAKDHSVECTNILSRLFLVPISQVILFLILLIFWNRQFSWCLNVFNFSIVTWCLCSLIVTLLVFLIWSDFHYLIYKLYFNLLNAHKSECLFCLNWGHTSVDERKKRS